MSTAVTSTTRVLHCTRCGIATQLHESGPVVPFTDPELFRCLPYCRDSDQLSLGLGGPQRTELRTMGSDPTQNTVPF